MSDKIGSAYVEVDANTSPAEAAFRKLQADADRTMAELGRKKAELEINAKTVGFDREIDKVKTEIDNLKRKKASITIEADTKQLDADIAEAEAELKSLTGKKRKITIDSRDLRNTNRDASLLGKTMAANEKLALDTAKANDRLASSRARDNTNILKNRVEIDKLSSSYEKLAGQRQKLERGQRGIFSGRSIAQSEQEARALGRVGNEMELTKHRIEQLGGSVKGLDPALNKDRNRLENWFTSLSKVRLSLGPISGSLKQFGLAAGLLGPILFEVGGGLLSLIGVAGTAFTGAMAAGSAAAAGFGLSALGVGLIMKPVIGEIKAATAASTAYQKAVLKYGKDSTQAKTAQEQLGHTLKGISPGAREAIKSFGSLKTTWTKLTAAAKKPLFNAAAASINTVKALLPSFARESVATTKVAAAGWEKWMAALRSPGAKDAIEQIMGNFRQSLPPIMSGLQALGATIGHIASASSAFLPGLSGGFNDWAQSIEKAVGSGAQLEGKIGRLIGHMRDVGHLAQASGRFLVGFFNASANSGDDLTKSLTQTIDKWNAWMKTTHGKNSLSDFFSESAGATKEFFSSLANLSTLIFQISRATAPLANGFLKVVTFIGNIVTAADKLVGVKTIVQGLGVILGGLFVASKVVAYGEAIGGVLARLGLMGAATTADVGATEALTAATAELTAALTAEVAAGEAASAALGAEGLAAGAAGAETGLGGVAAAAGGAEAGMAGAEGSAGLLAAALAPEVLIPAATIGALALLIGNTGKAETAWTRAATKFRETGKALSGSVRSFTKDGEAYGKGMTEQAVITDKVSAARQRLIKLQKENAPEAKLTQAVLALNQAEHEQIAVGVENARGRVKSVAAAKQTLAAAKANIAAAKEKIKANKEEQQQAIGPEGEKVKHGDLNPSILRKEAEAQKSLSQAQREAGAAARELTVANIPLERQTRGLAPITDKTAESLKKLSSTIGSAATKKIGNFINPGDVAKVANLSNHLTKLGQGSTVKKIDVKSNGADQTINKLQQVSRQSNKISGKVAQLNVKTNDTGAQQKLSRLSQLSQKVAGAHPTLRILANASNAEQAAHRIEQHLHHLAEAKYQARITAIDQATAPGSKARATLTAAAQGKYQARITAVDNASAPAKKAKQAADSVKGTYAAHVSAPGAAQAASQIASVTSALAAMPTSKTVTVHYTSTGSTAPHHFAGGPGEYAAAFATGGMSDQQMQRAYNQSGEERNGESRKVNKPTMLVGEQPGHPEYVIATNPSYRSSNERYLDQAAGDLGYDLVPAYAKGHGHHHKHGGSKSGGSKSGGDSSDPGPAPYKPQNKKHWTVHKHRFAPNSVNELNTSENILANEEHFFNAELSREEQEIAHKTRTSWDFATLKGYLQREQGIEHKIINTLIPAIASASNSAYNQAEHELQGPLSAKNVHAAQKTAAAVGKEYSNLKSPTKQKGESENDYKARVKAYTHQKAAKKAQAKEAANYAKRLEKERGEAQQMKEDARQELTEVRQEVRAEHMASLRELETQETGISDVEAHPELAPYYEAPGSAGGEIPTPAEQTASFNTARQSLYQAFAGNLAGLGVMPVTRGGPGGPGAGAGVMSGLSASPGSFGYLPAPTTGQGSGPFEGAGNAATGSTPGSNTIINNFAAPPPDPHTWTMQQQFEIGALA